MYLEKFDEEMKRHQEAYWTVKEADEKQDGSGLDESTIISASVCAGLSHTYSMSKSEWDSKRGDFGEEYAERAIFMSQVERKKHRSSLVQKDDFDEEKIRKEVKEEIDRLAEIEEKKE
ncbi:hypothetical protein DL98DRAFT_537249 [Cadophora sp. DSE1049]|nr:hypothetical protein DL98DRAFT_537249 [Cadophora sp. DSE1049]